MRALPKIESARFLFRKMKKSDFWLILHSAQAQCGAASPQFNTPFTSCLWQLSLRCEAAATG